MALGVLAAVLSALCYGVASVLQSKAAQVDPAVPGQLPLHRMVTRGPFVGGVLLDAAGFVAQFAALRAAPVFLVQAALAGSLAVTAAVAGVVLKIRLSRSERVAVGLVCAGLAALGLSAGAEGATRTGVGMRVALVVAVLVLAGVGATAQRLRGPAGAGVMGLVAGLGFGVVALAARALPSLTPARLAADPAAYALIIGGAVAFLGYARALQRGAVTAVTAAVVAGETLLPAIAGILVFGDRTRPGATPFAIAGFAVTLIGAARLARFGELKPAQDQPSGEVATR